MFPEGRKRLLDIIDYAFRGVELGIGVSLHETIVLDNYGSPEERQAAREPDEKHDWRKLVDDPELHDICRAGGMCFFDADGMRFHLPACLWFVVKEMDADRDEVRNVKGSLLFHLTGLDGYERGRFSILDDAQRRCVWQVLSSFWTELEDSELFRSVKGYWNGEWGSDDYGDLVYVEEVT